MADIGGERYRAGQVSAPRTDVHIGPDDPRAPDIVALIEEHLVDMHGESPPEHVHAMPATALVGEGLQFFSARLGAELVAIGALKAIGPLEVELKSMRTAPAWRRQGMGRRMLEHLLEVARRQGFRRVKLETGTMDYFAPARAMYAKVGFVKCPPFGVYTDNAYSVCMAMDLDRPKPV